MKGREADRRKYMEVGRQRDRWGGSQSDIQVVCFHDDLSSCSMYIDMKS